MIDWIAVGKHSLWISGLSIVLASLSWASWAATRRKTSLRVAIAARGTQVLLSLGGGLVAGGLFLTSGSRLATAVPLLAGLERVWWLAVAVLCAARAWIAHSRPQSTASTAGHVACSDAQSRRGPSSPTLDKVACWAIRAEPWLLVAAMPMLMFPNPATPVVASLLLLPWLARKRTQGHFSTRTPMDVALFMLVVMLPVSLWASMDVERSLPKLYGAILGMAVFYVIVNRVKRSAQAYITGLAIALVALVVAALSLIGTDWSAGGVLAVPEVFLYVPRLLAEMGGSLAGGFHPNEVAATLSLFIPFMAGLLFLGFLRPQHTATETEDGFVGPRWLRSAVTPGLLALGLLLMLCILSLTQSRSAFLGIAAAFLVLVGFQRRRLWPVLLVVAVVVCLYAGPQRIANSILAVGAERNVRVRFEIWQRALCAIRDFPYTGVGLNNFPLVVNTLYPLFLISSQRMLQLTHAHNAYLQMAVDAGIPGLVAYLGLLLGFGACWWTAHKHFASGPLGALSMSLLCGMVGYHVYGLTDCITLGAKPGVVIWAMLGLMAALANLCHDRLTEGSGVSLQQTGQEGLEPS